MTPKKSPDEQPLEDAAAEDASGAEAARSAEGADAPADADDDTAASPADAASTPADADDAAPPEEEEPEPEADAEGEEPEADAEDEEPGAEAEDGEPEAEAKPTRRPRRRGPAEPEAEKAATPAKPSKPAPRRRRSQRDPELPPPVVRAQAKYVRSSARKARLVCDHIRGKSVDEARAILALTPRGTARDWSKLLESAVANAEHNHELVGEDLYIKAVHADEGPTIPRYRPRARGRATKIRKRTSHLTILLTPKD
jgi:large subunit ribosomal protein L22